MRIKEQEIRLTLQEHDDDDDGMAKIRKERQTSVVHQPWGQGDGAEVRHLEPGSIRE